MKVKELAIIILMITIIGILSIKVEATTGKINSETVNLRKEPNTNSPIIEQLDRNNEVEILEQEDGWYKVKITEKKITGYVSEKLVDIEENNTLNQSNTTSVSENTITSENLEDTTSVEKQINSENTTTQVNEEIPQNSLQDIDIEPTTKTIDTSTKIEEDDIYKLEQETEIKSVPLVNSRVIAKISGNITILETINEWCRVESNTEIGWIRINYLKKLVTSDEQQISEQPENESKTSENQSNEIVKAELNETEKEEPKTQEVTKLEKTGYVDAEGLIVREEASTSSKELDCLSRNNKVEITGEIDGWYQIKIKGNIGYVASKYISDTKTVETTSRSGNSIKTENIIPMEEQENIQKENKAESENEKSGVTGTKVVEYAKQYLKSKYVLGGISPLTGFDCSGFTLYVYKHFGISLNRSSSGQIENGVAVEKDDLQLGDIVVFNNTLNTKIGHVGIYIGEGNFIHASNPSEGVKITSLSSSYYNKRYVGARRVI